jgi:hypothetical protein
MARQVYGTNTEWTESQLERLKQFEALVRADERALAAQPAVPDAITDTSESLDYIQGWNDCRAEMLKGTHEPV